MFILTCKQDRNSLEAAKNVASSLKELHFPFEFAKESPIESKIEAGRKNAEMVIAVGDDGFILDTFRRVGKSEIPLFPIASSQSFLATGNTLNFKNCLNLIKKGKHGIFKRSRIVAKFDSKTSQVALNDIGLFPSKSASLLKYSLQLNDESFWTDSSDGLIVSTPTGSTGYSLSAGGPIIVDEPSILTITSISSLQKHPSLVVSDNSKIRIKEIEGDKPVIVIDGEIRIPIGSKEISIEKSQYGASFVIFSKEYSLESKLKKRSIKADLDKLKDLPASAKLIYNILQSEGSMTQKEIISSSMLPERTARYALNLLLKKNAITTQSHFRDARQVVYGI